MSADLTAAECPNCRCRDMGGADQWREDGKGFRRGRWFVVEEGPGGFTVTHDDLNDYSYYYRPDCPDLDTLKPGQIDYHARATVHDFLIWHAATYPPAPACLYIGDVKMTREALCVAQHEPGLSESQRVRLGRLIDECDRHRPVGPNGKHGNRHTPTCGCDS